jgi:hypothetical protein
MKVFTSNKLEILSRQLADQYRMRIGFVNKMEIVKNSINAHRETTWHNIRKS